MRSEKVRNYFIFLLTFLVLFILFEIVLRIFKPQIYEIHPKDMYVSNSTVGYVLNPKFQGFIEREEFKQFFEVNNTYLRGKEIPIKSDESYRILILGDSYTFGFGVKDNEVYSSVLQKCLSKQTGKRIEVINAGVPGYGTIDELHFLKLIGTEINPDLIILQFLSVTDFDENRTPAVEWTEVRDGYLTAKRNSTEQANSFSLDNIIFWLKTHLHSAKFFSERLGYLAMKSGIVDGMDTFWGEDFSEHDEEITSIAIEEIIKVGKELNAEVLLLYTVGQGQVISEKQTELPSEKFISRVAQNMKVKWFNTLREFRKRSDKNDLYFPIDGHWTPKGHSAVAEILCNELIQQITFPSPNKIKYTSQLSK